MVMEVNLCVQARTRSGGGAGDRDVHLSDQRSFDSFSGVTSSRTSTVRGCHILVKMVWYGMHWIARTMLASSQHTLGVDMNHRTPKTVGETEHCAWEEPQDADVWVHLLLHRKWTHYRWSKNSIPCHIDLDAKGHQWWKVWRIECSQRSRVCLGVQRVWQR
jgi:hypothetical protein